MLMDEFNKDEVFQDKTNCLRKSQPCLALRRSLGVVGGNKKSKRSYDLTAAKYATLRESSSPSQ